MTFSDQFYDLGRSALVGRASGRHCPDSQSHCIRLHKITYVTPAMLALDDTFSCYFLKSDCVLDL